MKSSFFIIICRFKITSLKLRVILRPNGIVSDFIQSGGKTVAEFQNRVSTSLK